MPPNLNRHQQWLRGFVTVTALNTSSTTPVQIDFGKNIFRGFIAVTALNTSSTTPVKIYFGNLV